MAKRPKVCIDRVLPRDLMRLQQTKPMRNDIRRAISPIGKTWMNGLTLRLVVSGCNANVIPPGRGSLGRSVLPMPRPLLRMQPVTSAWPT